MTPRAFSGPRRPHWGVVVAVALLHLAGIALLVRAFAPDLTAQVRQGVTSAFTVIVTTPPPSPSPDPPTAPSAGLPKAETGQAGAAGRTATPRSIAAARPKLVVANRPAPEVAGAGAADRSGARDAGDGTGAGGQGAGLGAGQSGNGTGGGGGGSKAVKIAGEISSARDYPVASREARLGDHVIVALTVGADGRVTACRIVRASRDPQADAITCRLATARFRFRPATDAAGNPVESVYGWRQRWFDPRKGAAGAEPAAAATAKAPD